MRKSSVGRQHIIVFGFFAVIVLFAGLTFWLANANIRPQSQHMQLVLPDERISR